MLLINTSLNHSKFYQVLVAKSDVVLRWGRIGTRGQVKTVEFENAPSALVWAEDKIDAKLNRGYVPVVQD